MLSKSADVFWNTDLEVIEATFLKERKVTDLPVRLDDRVPPQGSVTLSRTVNVDQAVDRLLSAKSSHSAVKRSTLISQIFNRLVFG